jgi:hypothetical protein
MNQILAGVAILVGAAYLKVFLSRPPHSRDDGDDEND